MVVVPEKSNPLKLQAIRDTGAELIEYGADFENLAEGAGSAGLRAAFRLRDRLAGKRVAVQMSGGNACGEERRQAMALQCLIDGTC